MQKCINHGISYSKASSYRYTHPELTDNQIIEYYKQKHQVAFAQKCIENGIETKRAYGYKYIHPELTDNQIIVYYRPDLRLNIFGEIIE